MYMYKLCKRICICFLFFLFFVFLFFLFFYNHEKVRTEGKCRKSPHAQQQYLTMMDYSVYNLIDLIRVFVFIPESPLVVSKSNLDLLFYLSGSRLYYNRRSCSHRCVFLWPSLSILVNSRHHYPRPQAQVYYVLDR